MRKPLLFGLFLMAALVVVVLVLPSLIDINRYHDRIQADLEKRLTRKVQIGNMRLSILPLSFRADDLVIAEEPRLHSDRAFARARELEVRCQFWPLLHGEIQIDTLVLRDPQIELVRSAEGVWNFSSLGQPSASAESKAPEAPVSAPAQTAAPSKSQEFSLAQLRMENGQVALTDLRKHAPRAVYDHIDLTVQGYAPGQAFDLSAAAHLPGQGTQTIGIDARVGPVRAEDLTATQLDGKVRLSQVSLAGLNKFLEMPSLAGSDGVATGEARVKNDGAKLAASGSLGLNQVRIKGVDIGYPLSAEFDFSNDWGKDLLTIQKGALTLGSTPLSVSGVVNLKPATAEIDLAVKTSNASIQGLAHLLAALGVSFHPGMNVDGRLTADLRAQGTVKQPALNGTLGVQSLAISGKDLAAPIAVDSIQLALSPQQIRSNSFAASSGNSRVEAQFLLAQYTTANPEIDVTLRTGEAKVAELLSMARAYGLSAVEGMSGTGTTNLDVHATGSLNNLDSMNFSGNGQLRGVSLRLPQLPAPLEIQRADLRFTRNSVAMENLAVILNQTKAGGSLTVQNFSAPQLQFVLTADKVDVGELERLFASQPAPRAANWSWSLVGTAQAATTSESFLAKATGTGKVSIGTVVRDQLQLNNLRSDVSLNRGTIRLAPLTAELYGGQESGSITIDTREEPMLYMLSSDFRNVDANKLFSAVSSVKNTIYGPLAATANGTFRAGPADQIARSLDGTLSVDLRNGRIEGFSLIHELGAVSRFLNIPGPAKSYTDVTQMSAKFQIREGVARTDDLKAILDSGTVSGAGTVNLVSQALDMKLVAVLSKEMSQSVGGSSIGGWLNTALANKSGELIMPVIVTGTLQKPKFAPDAEKIAKLKLQNVLPVAGDTKTLQDVLQNIFGKPPKKEKPPQ
jgi:uncharacterized protein involved in outer membrane biogenesis